MIRLGILGAAGIAPQAVIRPARRRDDLTVVAVASRNIDAARRYSATHNIERAYGTYEALLGDPDIDVVYVALPPSEHARWAIAAVEAGKHALCEKPITMNAAEAAAVALAADRAGRHVIEAFHDHYHPLMAFMTEFRWSGRLGQVTSISTSFTADNPFSPTSLRHVPELGGGALMDLGCYPVHWLRTFMDAEPEVESATSVLGPLGADESIKARLTIGGVVADLEASMAPGVPFAAPFTAIGTLGSVSVDNLVLPHRGHSVTLMIDGVSRTQTVGGVETYDYRCHRGSGDDVSHAQVAQQHVDSGAVEAAHPVAQQHGLVFAGLDPLQGLCPPRAETQRVGPDHVEDRRVAAAKRMTRVGHDVIVNHWHPSGSGPSQ